LSADRAGVSGQRPLRGDHVAGALNVAVHLCDQVRRGAEAPLSAQALEELKAQAAAVEVALKVDDERLDQLTPARLEGGTHAYAHGREAAVAEACIDAVAGAHQRLVGDQVRRRETELAPAFIAVHHLALELEGRP